MIESPPEVEARAPEVPNDAALLQLARDGYQSSTGYFDTNIRREIEIDLRHWQSIHAAGSKYYAPSYAGRSKLFRPRTRAAIIKAESEAAEAFFSSVDVVNVSAYDREDADQSAIARFYKALLSRRLSEPAGRGIPWYLTVLGAYQDTLVVGVAVSLQYWQYDERRGLDRPMVDLVPLENFRFDPAADWRDPVGTSPYLVRPIPMYVKDVKERVAAGKYRRTIDEKTIRSGAKPFSDSIRLQREGVRQDPKEVSHEVTDFSIVWVHENIVEIDGADVLYYTMGTEIMLSDPVPVTNQYPQGRPFVVGFSTVEAHKHYPSGVSRLGRSVQREINDLANQRQDNVSFVLNKRYFVKRNQQVDLASIVRNMPGSATLMNDPEKDVRVLDTPDVTRSAYEEHDRLNLEFDDVAGQFAGSSVQSNRKLNETVGGMNILTANANQIGSYRLRTFVETWVEPVLRQLVVLEQHLEGDERIISMAVRESSLDAMGPAVHEAVWDTDVIVRVDVGMGATNPTDKANILLFGFNSIKNLLADGVLQAAGMNVKETISEIFAMLGYRDGSRFFDFDAEDPRIADLMRQIEELQAVIDAKYPPELLAAQVRKLNAETIAKNVESSYEAMQGGQVIAAVPSVAPVADEILRGAGFVPDPNGVDPNLPQPSAPDPALMQGDVTDRRTGVSFNPAGPETPGVGQRTGIETMRADGTA